MAELGSGEAKSVKSLIAKAAEIGVTYDIMKKIKDELHIISERHGNTWFWKWEQ